MRFYKQMAAQKTVFIVVVKAKPALPLLLQKIPPL